LGSGDFLGHFNYNFNISSLSGKGFQPNCALFDSGLISFNQKGVLAGEAKASNPLFSCKKRSIFALRFGQIRQFGKLLSLAFRSIYRFKFITKAKEV